MTPGPKPGILLFAVDAAQTRLVSAALAAAPTDEFALLCCRKVPDALRHLRAETIHTVILDVDSPVGGGAEIFERLFAFVPHVPFLILCSPSNERIARFAVRRGASEYMLKSHLQPLHLRRIVSSLVRQCRASEAAFFSQQCADAVLNCSSESVLVSNNSGHIVHLNPAAETVTGWTRAEAVGQALADVFPVIDNPPSQTPGAPASDSGSSTGKNICSQGVTLRRRDGELRRIKHVATPVHDRSNHLAGGVVLFHDLSAARASALQLSHQAQHDFLTDLPNRLLLNDRITQAISFAVRYSQQLAVMFVDLDHFKQINDTWGHATGDKLLQAVSSRILSCVRRSDTVSRHGGDEFVVLLSQVEHAEDAVFIARKILSCLAAPYSIEQNLLHINASIGVSTYPGDGQDAESLIAHADTAMYDAKKLGRNNCQFFRADMQARVQDWQSLKGNLRNALDRQEFTLHYQPKINLQSAEVSGVEALIRWKHPERGLIQPMQFVPAAEESGLIVPIGQWVLQEACRQARAWIEAGLPPVRMAVNVSAVEFMNAGFLAGVRATLLATGVDPRNLELELTETVLMHDVDTAITTLHELKSMGVQLAVDDFGTGYSNFGYLRKFPLDSLKVDRSFMGEIFAAPGNAAILNAMINVGKSLGCRVVAEGVETQSQIDFLQRSGCTEGQGYFFSHPVVAEKFAQFLELGAHASAIH